MKTDVTDRDPRTRAELEVRRVYEPSRLASAYVKAAYAQVVPRRQRTTRSSSAVLTGQIVVVEHGFHAAAAVSWRTLERSAVRMAVVAMRPALVR